MNIQTAQPALKLFLLTIFALTSSCAPLTAAPSPTATPAPSQTPTATVTPSPTNTPEPIGPKGIIFYSDRDTLYSMDLESQKPKIVLQDVSDYWITDHNIYATLFSKQSNGKEIFRTNLDGSEQQQLTTAGVIQIFNIDPTSRYLVYNNNKFSLVILDLLKDTSQVVAERNENVNGSEWIIANSWSPDGKKFIYGRVINPASDDICTPFIYDITTKLSTELSRVGAGCGAMWSPDSQNILFTTFRDQQLQMGIFNLESATANYIPIGGRSFYSGAWSRDHEQFLMAVFDEQNQTYLYMFDWETVSVSLISKIGRLQHPLHFSWSPNGDMVLYEQEEPSLSYKHYLYWLDIKNKKITNLYTLLGLDAHFDYWWDYSPTWSPDGKYFAYFTMSSGEIDYEQDFVLNIESIETEGNIQIQVPRKGSSIRMFWINDEIESEN